MLRAVERATPRVWSVGRQVVPNALPVLCGLPFLIAALYLKAKGQGLDIGLVVAAIATPAITLNWLGMTGNVAMRRLLEARLQPSQDAIFVGYAPAGFKGLLDPHADLGFLTFDDAELTFRGEQFDVHINRSRDIQVGFAFNPHSLLGLGRWLSVSGRSDEGPVTMLIEPRQAPTLLANRKLGVALKARVETWRSK